MAENAMQVVPGRSVGFMTLGSSLHEVLTTIKAEVKAFPTFQLIHSGSQPLKMPVYVKLPDNGLRLQFDGPDQRLRLIEVLDFTKVRLTYKDMDVFKPADAHGAGPMGPSFRHVYDKLLGPTYPGEYVPPKEQGSSAKGTYNLSYPGIAFNFPIRHSSYIPNSNNILSSSATGPASSMAVFSGESWQKARGHLFTAPPAGPRAPSLATKGKDGCPDEIELARIHDQGRIELVRRSSPSFWIILSETTPQDLIMELGPPDSIYKKSDHRLSIHGDRRASGASTDAAHLEDMTVHSDGGSADWVDDDDDDESAEAVESREVAAAEQFYNYYHHGFDILISQPTQLSPAVPSSCQAHPNSDHEGELSAQPRNHLTATKVIFHGNIPGSYQFNRHRRSRWTLEHVSSEKGPGVLTSEMPFQEMSPSLTRTFKSFYENEEEERLQQRGMALNRGWGDSPGSSTELLGGLDDASDKRARVGNSSSALVDDDEEVGNVQLFGFPGLIFEVLKNGAITALTVY